MSLPIRSASRFLVGVAVLREIAKSQTGNHVTLAQVGDALARNDVIASNLRGSIERVADREADWIRNNAVHTTASKQVEKTRQAEMDALNAVGRTVMVLMQHGPAAAQGKAEAKQEVHEVLLSSIAAIDGCPGRPSDKRDLLFSLEQQGTEVCGDARYFASALQEAQREYLSAYQEARLEQYRNRDATPEIPDTDFEL